MADPFVSLRGRVLINVEAMNMTESVGNYVKHRRVPVIMPDTYATYFVPAISGESIAHGYQRALAEEAAKEGLPVCKLCKGGYFLKSSNDEVFKESFGGMEPPEDGDEFEKAVIEKCFVEDVGGFLYAPTRGGRNVKRTSNFFVGYMIPVRESLGSAVIEPQLHTRYALGTPFVEKGGRTGGQMIYYVELSSAIYSFSFDLDTKYLGRRTFSMERAGELAIGDDERRRRLGAALDALSKFVIDMAFGAKRTRFLPIIEWESIAIAVSDDVWTVPSPFSKGYIERAEEKAGKVSYNTRLFKYAGGAGLEEVIEGAVEEAKRRAGIKGEK